MFSGFMVDTWVVASIVAVVAGVVGCFVVLRGSTFVAHAVPVGAFAGAAGASLVGLSTLLGLGVFGAVGAVAIALLGRRAQHDVATALALVVMLGLGALFLGMSVEYAPEVYALLFGEVLGISTNEIVPTAALAVASLVAIAILYRPLLLSSVVPQVGEARGVARVWMELCFLLVVALVTTMAVPVVGTLLIFALMVGPAGAARALSDRPHRALALSAVIALVTVWAAIAASYLSNWPVGFYVGVGGALGYGLATGWARVRGTTSTVNANA
jgi:zinc/manganese transport system permease protein